MTFLCKEVQLKDNWENLHEYLVHTPVTGKETSYSQQNMDPHWFNRHFEAIQKHVITTPT